MTDTSLSNVELRTMLLQALNKNTVSYSNVSKMAATLSDGLLNISFDSNSKSIIFSCGNQSLRLYLNDKSEIRGLYSINDIPIANFLTKVDLEAIHALIDTKADRVHTHAIEDITDLQASLDNKADAIHTHTIEDITDLQASLDNKADAIHTHEISDINSLQDSLDNKANAIHTHTLSEITDYKPYDDTLVLKDIEDIKKRESTYVTNGAFGKYTTILNEDLAKRFFEKLDKNTFNEFTTLLNDDLNTRFDGKSNVGHAHTMDSIVDIIPWFEANKEYFTGPRGPPGKDGLDGHDGQDGSNAKNWLWDMIDGGIDIYLIMKMNTTLTALSAKDTADSIVDGYQSMDDITDDIKNGSRAGKLGGWIKQCWNGIKALGDGYKRIDSIQQQPIQATADIMTQLLTRALPSITDNYKGWLFAKYTNMPAIIDNVSNAFTEAGYTVSETDTNSFWRTMYALVGELSNKSVNIDSNGQLSLPNCVNIIIKQPHPISGELTDTVVATMNDIDMKADKAHTHSINDIKDIEEASDRWIFHTENIMLLDYSNGAPAFKAISKDGHTHSLSDITDYVEPVPYDDTEVRGLINEKANETHTHDVADIRIDTEIQVEKTFTVALDDNDTFTLSIENAQPDMKIVRGKCKCMVGTNPAFGGAYFSITFTVSSTDNKNITINARDQYGTEHNFNYEASNTYVFKIDMSGDGWYYKYTKLLSDCDNKAIVLTNSNVSINDVYATQTVVNNKANAIHTHSMSDITDYVAPTPYDDTEVRGLIDGKADKLHTHDSDNVFVTRYLDITKTTGSVAINNNNDTITISMADSRYIHMHILTGHIELHFNEIQSENYMSIDIRNDMNDYVFIKVKYYNEDGYQTIDLGCQIHKNYEYTIEKYSGGPLPEGNIIISDNEITVGTRTTEYITKILNNKADIIHKQDVETIYSCKYINPISVDGYYEFNGYFDVINIRMMKPQDNTVIISGEWHQHGRRYNIDYDVYIEDIDNDHVRITAICGDVTVKEVFRKSNEYHLKYVAGYPWDPEISTKSKSMIIATRSKVCIMNDINGKANAIHTHTLSEITDYVAPTPYDDTEVRGLIDGKANKTHKHSISDIENLQSNLDNKQNKLSTELTFTAGSDDCRIKLYPGENGSMELATADDGNEPIYARQYHITNAGRFGELKHEATIMDANGNQKLNEVTVSKLNNYNINGVSETKLKSLQSIVTINDKGRVEVADVIDFHVLNYYIDDTFGWDDVDYNIRQTANYDTDDNTYCMRFTSGTSNKCYIDAMNIKKDNETRLKAVETNKAPKSHTHNISDITNLQSTLNGKASASHTHTSSQITDLKSTLLSMIYPIGSIYTSMNDTSPTDLFGGTWTQIKDRFLYCTSGLSYLTGGSKKIEWKNMPPHTHDIPGHTHGYTTLIPPNNNTGNPDGARDSSESSDTGRSYWRGWNHGGAFYNGNAPTEIKSTAPSDKYISGSAGSGSDYMPPYITVYAWYRTA